jgi:hypothetical protein
MPRDENHRREKYISAKPAFDAHILSPKQRQRKPQKPCSSMSGLHEVDGCFENGTGCFVTNSYVLIG